MGFNKYLYIFLVASALLIAGCATSSTEPIIFKGKPAEVTVYSSGEHSFRITIGNIGQENKAPDNPAIIEKDWGKPVLQIQNAGAVSKVKISGMNVTVHTSPLSITVQKNGRIIQEFAVDEQKGKLSFPTDDGPVLGLGVGNGKFDKRGEFYTNANGQIRRSPDDTIHYSATNSGAVFTWRVNNLVPFLIGTKGWAFFIATPEGQVDLKDSKRGIFLPVENSESTPLDLIFFDASQPLVMMGEITRLVGKSVIPPKWSLGYMQSHRTLGNTETMIGEVDTFRQKKLPLDAVIYLGSYGNRVGNTVVTRLQGWNTPMPSFEFNPQVFDIAPDDFINEIHQRNVKVVLHVMPPGGRLQLRGSIPAAPDEVEDSTSISISNYWQQHVPVFNLGVDGWWPDFGDEYTPKSRILRQEMYYKGSIQDRPNVRPWHLHRNGYLGIGRFGGWVWSGDPTSNWKTLEAHIAIGLNYSLTVSPYWGSDIGGFSPTPELTGELYTRWFQFSVFCPSFRSHGSAWRLRLPWGWNLGSYGPLEGSESRLPDKFELHNAAVELICREYLNLRYRLLPYNYSLTREAYDEGLPMMRPLWLYYPQDPIAAQDGKEYLWGKDMLIAPVVEKGATKRNLYLPPGNWYNWWTNEKIAGGKFITCNADLTTLPIFVKAGAIIPLDPIRQYTAEKVSDPTTIQIYEGADGQFTMYEDDGESLEYLKGQGLWTQFSWENNARQLTISRDPKSTYNLTQERKFIIRLLPEGKETTISFFGKLLKVKI